MSKKVCILNYGSGNIKSVFNMLNLFDCEVVISNNTESIRNATHLILPGVSAFGSAMAKMKSEIPIDVVSQEVHQNKKPFLGICVGMQILATKGYEFGEHEGLGWIDGEVRRLEPSGLPVPHVGWNEVIEKQTSCLFTGIPAKSDFYFVHSYAFTPRDLKCVIAETEYGDLFPSIVQKENIFGVQFHPEKSQQVGKALIENFLNFK